MKIFIKFVGRIIVSYCGFVLILGTILSYFNNVTTLSDYAYIIAMPIAFIYLCIEDNISDEEYISI